MRDISASDAGAGSAILSTLQQATLGLGPAILGSLFLALAYRMELAYEPSRKP